ncbi:hypothetical protein [Petrimonas sulfuriphila]|uniref:hypothetical protein n=1 Tax=Petrimonas sulfuriphila TaxID=285070 RepID=UPI003EB9E40E
MGTIITYLSVYIALFPVIPGFSIKVTKTKSFNIERISMRFYIFNGFVDDSRFPQDLPGPILFIICKVLTLD